MQDNEISGQIVDAAYRVHVVLGPGLLESVYEEALAFELREKGLGIERQLPLPVTYRTIRLEIGYRADLIVENRVIVEIKSVSEITAIHKKQLLTYLRLANKKLGLLINFNVLRIKEGITRIANGL